MDASTAFTCVADTIRYHPHFVKEGYSLPDGIHYLPGLKPSFSQPPSTSRDGLNPSMEAVCGGSPAVKEAVAEARAPPRRSEEPGLGSSAALAQQFDRVARTRRVARSSRRK